MKLIATSYGTLFISPLPSLEELFDNSKFNIIWNLAAEFSSFESQEKIFASQVLLGEIEDYDIPRDVNLFRTQLKTIVECLKNNGRVLVHCLGGRGRTGMATACIKFYLDGLSVNECLNFTKSVCGGPEVEEQVAFVENFCSTHSL